MECKGDRFKEFHGPIRIKGTTYLNTGRNIVFEHRK